MHGFDHSPRPGRALARLAVLVLLWGCSDDPAGPREPGPDDDLRRRFSLRALGEIPYPPDNLPSANRIALGRLLFSDPILSGEMDVACATCHHPSLAFADGRQFSAGAGAAGLGPARVASGSRITGLPNGLEARHAPTRLNPAFHAGENGLPRPLGV